MTWNPFASGTVDLDTGNIYGQGFLNKAAGALGGYVKSNPEQFAIMADMAGSKIAPNNPLAGIGSYMAKSSLANKAASKVDNMAIIQKIISGLTEGNAAGGNKVTISRGPEGRLKIDTSLNADAKSIVGPTRDSSTANDEDEFGILRQFLVE